MPALSIKKVMSLAQASNYLQIEASSINCDKDHLNNVIAAQKMNLE